MRSRLLIALGATMLTVGCMELEDVNLTAIDTPTVGWSDSVEFTFDNQDTLSRRDVDIFAYLMPLNGSVLDSLPLHIVTTAPDGARVVEQFTIYIDNRDGVRRQSNRYHETTYRSDVVWRQKGLYRVLVYPRGTVDGVESIGVKLSR